MRVFFIALLILFGISTQNVYAACTKADGTAGCDAGKYCDTSNESNPICTNCNDKYFCPGGTNAPQTPCGDGWAGSDSPRTSKNNCYKTCPTKSAPEFENGTWRPAADKIYYSITVPNPTCSYPVENITCNNASSKCTGFHRDGEKCISNIQDCSDSKHAAITYVSFSYTGKKVYDPTTGNYSECYITECPSDRHQENMGNMCGFSYANDCATNHGNCTDKLGNCTGTITGQYSWVNDYKYDDCRCESETSVANEGTYTNSCKLTNNKTGDNSAWGNCEYSAVKSCVEAKCKAGDAIKCVQSPAGYYSGNNETTCNPCPAGSTSAAGSSAQTQCYISGATNFRDKNGTFQLPIDKIDYQ